MGAGRRVRQHDGRGALPPPASPAAPVDPRTPHWHEAFASRLHWLVDHHVGEARIKLNPPELGALDVKISLQDDKTFVQLTAASSAARDELAQSLPRLRELLPPSGLELGGATVNGGRDGPASARRPWHDRRSRAVRGFAEPRRRACGRAARAASVASTSSPELAAAAVNVAKPVDAPIFRRFCSHRDFSNSLFLRANCRRLRVAWILDWGL